MTQNSEHGHEVPKMPSMMHLPWSQEDARQQKWLRESQVTRYFSGDVVILEKMDGANACLTSEKVYARSHSGEPHREEWGYLKKMHREELMHKIPENLAIFGEYLYARHSIKYTELPSYFLVFGVYNKDTRRWCSWEKTKLKSEELSLETVPEIDRFATAEPHKDLRRMPEGVSRYGDTREGYVVRNAEGFPLEKLKENMAKCVRENHVQTEELHWRKSGETETNDLQ